MKRDETVTVPLSLLKLDVLSYNVLLNDWWLKSVSLNISEKITTSGINRTGDDLDADLSRILRKQRFEYKMLNKNESSDRNYYDCYKFNSCLGNRHYYLSGIEYSRCAFDNELENGYILYFNEIEHNVINKFSLHPALESVNRGNTIEEDGSMIQSCFKYLRSYEKTLYTLSQQPFLYSRLIILLLIILLRNIRRLLHHFKTSIALIDLILLKVHSIYLTQNYLYKCCTSRNKTNAKLNIDYNMLYENVSSTFEKHKEMISTLCNDEINNSVDDLENIYYTVDDDSDTSNNNPISDDHELTLSYDKTDVMNINSQFNMKIDDIICKWIVDWCNYGSLCNKILNKPIFMDYNHIVNLNRPNFIKKFQNISLFRKQWLSYFMKVKNKQHMDNSSEISTSDSSTKPNKGRKGTKNKQRANNNRAHSSLTNPNRKARKSTAKSVQNIKLNEGTKHISEEIRMNNKGRSRWDSSLEIQLVDSVNRLGKGNWRLISNTDFSGKKTAAQIKDKWANLTAYNYIEEVQNYNSDGSKGKSYWRFVNKQK